MKTYKIETTDSFLESNEKIFYSDSVYESVTYITSQKVQMRFLGIPSVYTNTKKQVILVGPAFDFTHASLLEFGFEDGLIKQKYGENLWRKASSGDLDDCMIYCPMSLADEESTSIINSFREDYWSSFVIFEKFFIANKDTYGNVGDAIIENMKKRFKFIGTVYTKDNLFDYIDTGEIPQRHYRFS